MLDNGRLRVEIGRVKSNIKKYKRNGISLPSGVSLKENEIVKVVDLIKKFSI